MKGWRVETLNHVVDRELDALPPDMAIYVTAFAKRVVVVRVFVKKTEAIPEQEIALALARASEMTP